MFMEVIQHILDTVFNRFSKLTFEQNRGSCFYAYAIAFNSNDLVISEFDNSCFYSFVCEIVTKIYDNSLIVGMVI